MSVQLDARSPIAPSQQPQNQTYWDDPRASDPSQDIDRLNDNPQQHTGQDTVLAEPLLVSRLLGAPPARNAVPIDGTASNPQQRTQTATPDGKPIVSDPLHQGRQATVVRERTVGQGNYVTNDQLVFTPTGQRNDDVQVRQGLDGSVEVKVNGEQYSVQLARGQELTLRTGAGDDTIDVGADVRVNIVVEGGAGIDDITGGAGNDRIDGGLGDDYVDGGAGSDDVFGDLGNDAIVGGAGNDVLYSGDGDDLMAGGAGDDYLEGGRGRDGIDGEGGQDIISGGRDGDTLRSGAGNDRVYTGAGVDTVRNDAGNDVVYAQRGADDIGALDGAGNTVVNVELNPALGTRGISVEGSQQFRQRVEAEIDLLRSSPSGQQMLAAFDAAALEGNTVTIRQLAREQNGFAQTLGGNAQIDNGQAGSGADVRISYNPGFHIEAFPAPIGVLFHEMSHAYNGVNGTFQPGTYVGPDRVDSGNVPNAERQAVGLETSAAPYDFDGDPRTESTTHNPYPLTENGLRTEFGLPLRLHYTL